MHPLFLPIHKAQMLSYMKLLDIPLGWTCPLSVSVFIFVRQMAVAQLV